MKSQFGRPRNYNTRSKSTPCHQSPKISLVWAIRELFYNEPYVAHILDLEIFQGLNVICSTLLNRSFKKGTRSKYFGSSNVMPI